MTTYLGDFLASATIDYMWQTNSSVGSSITRATDGTIQCYKGNSTAEDTSGTFDTEDFDGLTGIHVVHIETTADAAFFATGNDFHVVLNGATIDGQSVNAHLFSFSIENRTIKPGGITSASLAGSCIDSTKLAGGALSSSRFGASSITSATLAAGTLSSTRFGASCITSVVLAAGALSSTRFGASSITSTVLAGAAISATRIADDAITQAKIATGAIAGDNIAANAITSGAIAADAIGTGEIANGALTSAKFGASSLTSVVFAADAINATRLADATLTSAKFAASAITSAVLGSQCIGTGQFANGTLGSVVFNSSILGATYDSGTDTLEGIRNMTLSLGADAITSATLHVSVKGPTYDSSTDTLEQIRDAGGLTTAQVKAECGSALIAYNLDHLMKVAVDDLANMGTGGEVVDSTVMAALLSSVASADSFDFGTDSLEAISDQGVGAGTATSANQATIISKLDGGAATVVSPVSATSAVSVSRDRDYHSADGYALEWTETGYSGPTTANSSGQFSIQTKETWDAGLTSVIATALATWATSGTTTATYTVSLASSFTSGLAVYPPDEYHYQVKISWSDTGRVRTAAHGTFQVTADVR
jgi:hypothetical protein